MALPKTFLNRMELCPIRKTLDCENLACVRAHGENRTRLHRQVVKYYRARATGARVAADMGPREFKHIPYIVNEEETWLHLVFAIYSVNADFNLAL
jgi:hypothetical protein